MQIVDLFSGIGGFSLAGSWLEWRTIQFCEIDPWCHKVLKRHWPNVPIHTDINTLTSETIKQSPLYDPNEETIVTGGVPCQPASTAGKRLGNADSRWLWPQTIRFIGEFKPTYALLENVAGLVSMENGKTLDTILSDLENEGYATEQVIIPACAVGAWHRRDRIWIIAHKSSEGLQDGRRAQMGQYREEQKPERQGGKYGRIQDVPNPRLQRQEVRQEQTAWIVERGEDAPDTISKRQRTGGERHITGGQKWIAGSCHEGDRDGQFEPRLGRMVNGLPSFMDGYWDREPEGVPRVATGVKDRVNRLKGLGNAIVPAVAYQIFKAIEEYDPSR